MSAVNLYSLETFTKKKEANLAYNLEQDNDLWLALLSEYASSNGEKSEFLKAGIIDESPEWKELARQVSKSGYKDLKELACNKQTRWHFTLRTILDDPVHAAILETYLRSLVALKLKKINLAFGGEVKQKINRVLSFAANEAFVYLGKYKEYTRTLAEGKTDHGVIVDGKMKVSYEEMQRENLNLLYIFLTIIVVFKTARCGVDIAFLQQYIQEYLVRPLEIRLASLKKKSPEHINTKNKLDAYLKLQRATDISFD
jgi:hypothetical protein